MALLHASEMRMRGIAAAWMVWCALVGALTIVLAAPTPALAQHRDDPARQTDNRPVIRRGIAEPVTDGHGWMVVEPEREGGRDGRLVLLHLPAREVGGDADSAAEDMEGVVRIAGEARGRWEIGHEGLAWWRNRVYLVIQERAESGAVKRRVLSREALRGMGSMYEYFPSKEFMELAPLPPSDALLGMAASEQGPVVWLARGAKDVAGRVGDGLWAYMDGKWLRMNAPWGEGEVRPVWFIHQHNGESRGEHDGLARLMSWRDGVAIANSAEGAAGVVVWVGHRAAATPATIRWQRLDFALGELASVERASMRLAFVEGARQQEDVLVGVVMAKPSELQMAGVARVYQLRSGARPIELAQVAGVPREASVVPMASAGKGGEVSGLVTLVWKEGAAASTVGRESAGLQVREISVVTGRALYAGPSRSGKHAARPMVQWIVVLALLAGVGAMMYLLASDPRVVPVLPAGVQLADPIRRLVAAVLDYVPSAILVAVVQGRSAMVLLMPSTMLGGADAALGNLDLRPMGLVILVTILHASACEWMLGKSLGKFVMGIRVVSIAGAGAGTDIGGGSMMPRPALGQVLVRNLVRWLVPMLALFGMLDVAGRHPGDLAARTLVVADANDGK